MANPVLSANQWEAVAHARRGEGAAMTVAGCMFKTMVLLAILVGTGGVAWQQLETAETLFGLQPTHAMIGAGLGGLVVVVILRFAPRLAMALGFLYAALEGVFLGVFIHFVDTWAPGEHLPLMAAGLTGCTLFGMLLLYLTRIVKVTPAFAKVIGGMVMGLVLGLLALWGLSMFFPWAGDVRAAIHGHGPVGIAFSVFVVALAAFTLLLDFDFIERGSKQGQPKYMEWLAAVGLLVSLVWLYIEILRLLLKLRAR